MDIQWREQYVGILGSGSVCDYRVSDPDSLGKHEVHAKIIGDQDIRDNWHFAGYEFGEVAAKDAAQKHEDSMNHFKAK